MDASSQFKDSLPTKPDALMASLSSLDISFTTHTHPPLRTVEDAKAFRGDLRGCHIKNLYLRDRKKRNFLLVVEEDKAIDLKELPNYNNGLHGVTMGLYTPYIPSQKMTRSERIEERIRQWRNRRSETVFFKNAFDEATNLQVDLKKLLQQVS